MQNIFKDVSYSYKSKKEIKLFFSYMRQYDPNFEQICKDYVSKERLQFLKDIEDCVKDVNDSDGGTLPMTEAHKYVANKKNRGKIVILPEDNSLSKDEFFNLCKLEENRKNKLNENIAIDCITMKYRKIEPYESIVTIGENGHVQMGQHFRHIFYNGEVDDNRHVIVPNGYALLFQIDEQNVTIINLSEAEKEDNYNDHNKFIINSEGVKRNDKYLYSRSQCVDFFSYLSKV